MERLSLLRILLLFPLIVLVIPDACYFIVDAVVKIPLWHFIADFSLIFMIVLSLIWSSTLRNNAKMP